MVLVTLRSQGLHQTMHLCIPGINELVSPQTHEVRTCSCVCGEGEAVASVHGLQMLLQQHFREASLCACITASHWKACGQKGGRNT